MTAKLEFWIQAIFLSWMFLGFFCFFPVFHSIMLTTWLTPVLCLVMLLNRISFSQPREVFQQWEHYFSAKWLDRVLRLPLWHSHYFHSSPFVPQSVSTIFQPKMFLTLSRVCLMFCRRFQWIRRDSSLGAPLCPPPEWTPLYWDNPLTTGHHGEHTADTPSPQPSSPGGPAGTSAWKLGDGLHRERRGLLYRVSNPKSTYRHY